MTCLKQVDSIVIDPHKHGLQPYGCGCVLFKDPGVGVFYKHDSPYTYFSSQELHLGEISLECSRPGASAVALWATQKLLPMVRGGEFAANLANRGKPLWSFTGDYPPTHVSGPCLNPSWISSPGAPRRGRMSRISALSQAIFETAAKYNLHLATFKYPTRLLKDSLEGCPF